MPARRDDDPQPPGPPTWSAPDQAWLVSRYADVHALLRHPQVGVARPAATIRDVLQRTDPTARHLATLLDGMAIFQDGAAHWASRAALKPFSLSLAALWPEAAIDRLVQDQIADLEPGCQLDAIDCIVDAILNAVAAGALRLQRSDVAWLRCQGQDVMTVWRPVAPLRECRRLEEVASQVRARLAEAPRCPHGGAPLPAAGGTEARDLEFFVLTAVVETTAATMGNAIRLLADCPDLQDRLRREPEQIPGFVEESMRLQGPVRRLNPRVSEAAIELGGQAIDAGASLLPVVESAHRDATVYPAPDRLDLGRADAPLLVFGGGSHACMGPRFARMELRIVLRRLLEAFRLEPAGEPVMMPFRNMRQLKSLPIVLQRRT